MFVLARGAQPPQRDDRAARAEQVGSPMRDDSSYRPCYIREITCKSTTSRPDSAHPPTETAPHPQSPTHQRTDAPTTQETTQTTNDARPPRPATSRDRHARYTRREWVAHPTRNAALPTENPSDSNSKTTASNGQSKPNIKVYINSCINSI